MANFERKDPSCIGKDGEPKAPEHRKAALRVQGKGAINEPIRTATTGKSQKEKKIKVGTQVKLNKNSERVKQILPFHKGYEDKVGEVVGGWGKHSYTIDFGTHPTIVGSRYQIVLEPKDLIIVSPPKRGYKHADAPTMEKVENFTEHLHGSGINYDWHIEDTKTAIKASNNYDTMNEVGYYDSVVPFTISFPKNEPIGNFKLTFESGSHHQVEKYGLREYLNDTIASVLDELGYR